MSTHRDHRLPFPDGGAPSPVVIFSRVVLRYEPPFTPWFTRRNEVMIPVAPAGDGQD